MMINEWQIFTIQVMAYLKLYINDKHWIIICIIIICIIIIFIIIICIIIIINDESNNHRAAVD